MIAPPKAFGKRPLVPATVANFLGIVCWVSLLCAVAAPARGEPAGPRGPQTPDALAETLTRPGPLAVETVTTLTVRDDRRGRDLKLAVHYPKAAASVTAEAGQGAAAGGQPPVKFPVIVFSHGYAANREAFAVMGQHWASHGYVCLHPEHQDARGGQARPGAKPQTDLPEGSEPPAAKPGLGQRLSELSDEQREQLRQRLRELRESGQLKFGKAAKNQAKPDTLPDAQPPAKPGGPDGQRLRERLGLGRLGSDKGEAAAGLSPPPNKLPDRVADVSAVIDALDQIAEQIPDLRGRLDAQRIGVGGHSFGACTAMLMGGVTVAFDGLAPDKTAAFADSRVRCVMPISAAGTGEYGLHSQSWKTLTRPTLLITGTRDTRPGHEANWRREPFDLAPPGDKYLVIIEGATHFDFGGRPGVETTTRLVKATSLAFWNAYLKDATPERELLAPKPYSVLGGSAATLEAK